MSTSAARIAANKANGLESTGPRTPEGKARVSENALKHGLRSERNPLDLATDTTLPFERQEFEATLAMFLDEFAPESPFETRLVERLAQIDLRLNRAVRMETSHLDISARRVFESMGKNLPTDEPRAHDSWLVALAFLDNPAALKLISQYESRLARDFSRTLTQLHQSQKLREQTQSDTRLETLSEQTPRSHSSDGVVAVLAAESSTHAEAAVEIDATNPNSASHFTAAAETSQTNPTRPAARIANHATAHLNAD